MTSPSLIIITGLPGTGKTTVALALAEKLIAEHLNTDMIRMEMGLRGQYDQETKERVYKVLLERASKAIKERRSVVVDGTFYQSKLRAKFKRLASRLGVSIYWVELWAKPEVIRKRVGKKRMYSEADFKVHLQVKAMYEPILDSHLRLESNDSNLSQLVQEVLAYLGKAQK